MSKILSIELLVHKDNGNISDKMQVIIQDPTRLELLQDEDILQIIKTLTLLCKSDDTSTNISLRINGSYPNIFKRTNYTFEDKHCIADSCFYILTFRDKKNNKLVFEDTVDSFIDSISKFIGE